MKFFAITLHDVQPAFIFLISGYALSLLFFIMEVAAAKHQQSRNLNKVLPAPNFVKELEMEEIEL